jgi:hypothetical protein
MGSLHFTAVIVQRVLRRLGATIFLIALSLYAVIKRRPILVVASPFGNLGNRLFLHANLIAFAIKNPAIVVNPAFHPWRRVFAGTSLGPLACYPPSSLPSVSGDAFELAVLDLAVIATFLASSTGPRSKWAALQVDGFEDFDLDSPEFARWARSKWVILLRGYNFIADQSMASSADTMRPYFRQIVGNDASAVSPVHRLRRNCDIVVGVVIRLSGFDRWLGGKYYFPVATYMTWIRQASLLWPDARVGFFICSDSEIDLSPIDDLPFEFRSQNDLENRAALACCDRIMAPPSSFAGWAAFIANIPYQLLHSPDQVIEQKLFVPIHNHIDLRDASFPAAVDVTHSLLQA